MPRNEARIPVFILTGFLGAGKSTLLNRVLRDPAFARTAIVINEFGDVALDHDLVRVGETQIARTTTGCMCCTIGSDIRATLDELHMLAAAGEIAFDRVIVETTGLADPAPLINDLVPGATPAFGLRDHVVARNFELAGVIALVDIMTGELAIENHFEATKQIAFADLILLTKTDLARNPASVADIEVLKTRLATINASATILDGKAPSLDPAALFRPRPYVPVTLSDDVAGWLALEDALRAEGAAAHTSGDGGSLPFDRHAGRIRTFTVTRDESIEPAAFNRFMELMSTAAGPRLLRAKGLVKLSEDPSRPRVIHAVQHVIYPTRVIDAWPSEDHRHDEGDVARVGEKVGSSSFRYLEMFIIVAAIYWGLSFLIARLQVWLEGRLSLAGKTWTMPGRFPRKQLLQHELRRRQGLAV